MSTYHLLIHTSKTIVIIERFRCKKIWTIKAYQFFCNKVNGVHSEFVNGLTANVVFKIPYFYLQRYKIRVSLAVYIKVKCIHI